MLSFLYSAYDWLLPFLLVLTLLVFFHELGHYAVARWYGVKVETFSIGFGPELFGLTDKHGTRWKFSLVPLGGYVKMFGDANEASAPDQKKIKSMTAKEFSQTLEGKTPAQRIAVSMAGPIANIILTLFFFAVVYTFYGRPSATLTVGNVIPGGAAARAGLQTEDVIQAADGYGLENFQSLKNFIASRPGRTVALTVNRQGHIMNLPIDIESHPISSTKTYGSIGVEPFLERLSPVYAVKESFITVVRMTGQFISLLKNIVTSGKDAKKLGSVLSIAKMSKDSFHKGVFPLLLFMGVLSLNLGVINLLPIPMLDGGHVMFYAYEWIFGRPLPEAALSWFYRIGLFVLIFVMLFTMWNDLERFRIVGFVLNLFK